MKISKVRHIILILGTLVFLSLIIVGLFQMLAFLWVSVILCVALLVFNLMFWRCPHCGEHLGRDVPTFCPHCGAKLEDE